MHRFTLSNGIKQTLEGILPENWIYLFVVQQNIEKVLPNLAQNHKKFLFGRLLFCYRRDIDVTMQRPYPGEA